MKQMEKKKGAVRLAVWASAAVLAVICAVTGVGAGAGQVQARGIGSLQTGIASTIPEGVYVDEVDVSGCTVEEATEAVENYLQTLGACTLTLEGREDVEPIILQVGELGLTWENPEVLEEALTLGRTGNLVVRYKVLKDLEHEKMVYPLEYSMDETLLQQKIEARSGDFGQKRVDYELHRQDGKWVVTSGQDGYSLDVEASVRRVADYLRHDWDRQDADIRLVIREDPALGSEEELTALTDVLGTFSTSYKSSGAARSANVANGCRLIDGTTLYPGQEFSVLGAITPFTEANGYFPAGSYLNGTVVESIGGGICQVSTTLYNAVLLAELEVTERHNHSMIVNYVDPSADAAIAETGGKNFRFVNNTDHPIYIEGHTADKRISFTIFGKDERPAGRKVSYESEVVDTTPAGPDQFVADPSQPIGSIQSQSAHIGYKAKLWKIVTENGQQVSRETVNTSTYKMVPRIYTVGIATGDPNAAAQVSTAIATGSIDHVRAVVNACKNLQAAQTTEGADVNAAQAALDAAGAAAAAVLNPAPPEENPPADDAEDVPAPEEPPEEIPEPIDPE